MTSAGVVGSDKLIAALNRMPKQVEAHVKEAIEAAAAQILLDMQAFTPQDPNSTDHARDALAVAFEESGLAARIGLPTATKAQEYFWFRFLDGGTKGGQVSYRRAGSTTRHTMTVPSRPALRIRERALDMNRDDIERLMKEAIMQALRGAT